MSVTNTYNGRGLAYSLSGSAVGTLVSSTLYNQLGQVTRINLGNGTYSTFTYYGLDNSSGYYGRPWQTKTTKTTAGDRQSLTYTWDANGNLTQRQNSVSGETETFTYDFLDRLTAVSGAYSNSFSYNTIGNITSKNGTSYTYGTKPHAVTAVGTTSYAYDANGNMTSRGSQILTWDVENRLVGVTGGGAAMSAVYDAFGNRVTKTEAGETTVFVNQFYEKNLTTGVVTTHYYLGGKEIAYRKGTTLEYICQDHLGSTSATTDISGNVVATIAYYPFGATRTSSGTLNTDKEFTGQRVDQSGLYYYGARYYDASIGRFISADSAVPSPANPQSLNRYTYCLNNPLRYVDPTGRTTAEQYLSNQINNLRSQAALLTLLSAPVLADPNAPPPIRTMAQNMANAAASMAAAANFLEVQLLKMVEARLQAEEAARQQQQQQQASDTWWKKLGRGPCAVLGLSSTQTLPGTWILPTVSKTALLGAGVFGIAALISAVVPADVNINQRNERWKKSYCVYQLVAKKTARYNRRTYGKGVTVSGHPKPATRGQVKTGH